MKLVKTHENAELVKGLKKPGKREIAYPWAVYDVEK